MGYYNSCWKGVEQTKTMTERQGKLWGEALKLATDFALNGAEPPNGRFEEIGEEMGGCTQDMEDLRTLLRVARKVKANNEKID